MNVVVRMLVKSWQASLLDADDYRSAMRRVGIAAIIVGAVDCVEFIIAIVHQKSYSSSLSIFAIIAGVALIRGNLNTCLKVVRWIGFSGGTAIGFTGGSTLAVLLAPGTPNDVIKALMSGAAHLDTEQLLISFVSTLLFAAVMVWGYRTLTSPVVLAAMRSGGVDCDSFFSKLPAVDSPQINPRQVLTMSGNLCLSATSFGRSLITTYG